MCTFLGYTVKVFMAERWKLKWKEKHVEILASFFMQVSVFCRKCPIGNTSWAIQKPVLLRTSAASWIYDVTFFSSHTSDLGFMVAKNVLCNVHWLPLRQSPHAHVVWGFVALLCWNVLLRLFTEYANLQCSTDVKNCWSLDFLLHPGIICSEEGLCNGCWELLVIGMAQVKTTQREPINAIFTLSSGCCKNNYLVIPLQPRKLLIWCQLLEVFKHRVYLVPLHSYD